MQCLHCVFFFFSSRRRHTRFDCDWSSDVCSSDLEFLAVAREAEARGYHTAWTGEVSGYDAISVMTLIASHTERIHVGSAVLPVQTRTPVVLGMSAASLNHFAPGRVGLGLGLSSRTIVADWHG